MAKTATKNVISKSVKPVKVAAKKAPAATKDINAKQFIEKLMTLRSATELQKYHRYFNFDENEKGKGDRFVGVRMGQVFALAKEFMDMPVSEIEKLLESPIHEIRAGGCSIMAKQASHKGTSESRRKELYDLYLRRHDCINNWDLVDLASYKVVGSYLFDVDKSSAILYKLAKSKNTWERRTAILATMHFIFKKETIHTFKIAALLLKDQEDLVHKGVGWALRTAGDVDKAKLIVFLDKYALTMPRVMLRYAIEKLDKKQREHYLKFKK